MKKFISAALSAAMILSMASISYSAAPQTSSHSLSQVVNGTSKKNTSSNSSSNKITQPKVPAMEDENYYDYVLKHQTPESFIKSLQKFGSKTAPMVLNQKKNQAYSPVSFAYALGILGSGANGETSQQIADALETDNMKSAIDGFTKFYDANYRDSEGNILKIANSLWMQKKYPIKSTFSKGVAKDFYSSIYSVDFSKKSTGEAMGKWISENTGGLLNPSIATDPMQVLSIINTLYFEGAWSDSFNGKNNTTEKFTLEDGSTIDTTYMNQIFEHAAYYKTEDYTMFILPFVGGQEMRFVLPNKDLGSILNQETLEEITSKPQEQNKKAAEVTLKLPKFNFDTRFNLKETCEKVGLEKLMEGTADLSGITDQDVHVSNIIQESHIEVDENGCKAAAYTQIMIESMALLPDDVEKYTFSLDRPFLFTLQSHEDAPLFIGTVYNPAK